LSSSHELVRLALLDLTEGLAPFVELRLQNRYGEGWREQAKTVSKIKGTPGAPENGVTWDAHSLLTVIWENWHEVFKEHLQPSDRNVVGELRQLRNRWAHQEDFDFDDTNRVLDDVHRLLVATKAKGVEVAEQRKLAWMRTHLESGAHGAAGAHGEQSARSTSRRMTHIDAVVFVICGCALGAQIFLSFGSRAWPAALLAGVAFVYILIRRATAAGAHPGSNCPTCGRRVEHELRGDPAPVAPRLEGEKSTARTSS
jgi:hypothetical protein